MFETLDDLIDFFSDNAHQSFQLALQFSRNKRVFDLHMAQYEAWKIAAKSVSEFKDSLRPRA